MMEVSFEVKGDPAPWSVYTKRGKPSLSFQKMQSWQAQIQAAAQVAMAGREMLKPPVALKCVFYLAPRKGKEQEGDTTNLFKAAEDAIQGIVFKNDRGNDDIHGIKKRYLHPEGLTVVWVEEVSDAT